jgi:hypothetical protein
MRPGADGRLYVRRTNHSGCLALQTIMVFGVETRSDDQSRPRAISGKTHECDHRGAECRSPVSGVSSQRDRRLDLGSCGSARVAYSFACSDHRTAIGFQRLGYSSPLRAGVTSVSLFCFQLAACGSHANRNKVCRFLLEFRNLVADRDKRSARFFTVVCSENLVRFDLTTVNVFCAERGLNLSGPKR